MKNDVILALVGFIVSALIAWISSLTVMVFEMDKELAVHKVEMMNRENK